MATWNFDPTHTSASFAARHMMITTVRGGFTGVSGTLEYDPENPAAASVEAVIDTRSMTSTGVEDRDNHLKSADFLDIEHYPTITFKSTKVEPSADGSTARITGDLTIRDVTRPVVLDAELLGVGKSPWGDERAGFTGSVTINREDFGLTWNMALETGGWLVSKDIKISLDLEAIRVTEAAPA
ncbi:MAG: polyisoprenoid-binding protein [Anaerolineaceae bacterium]|nr:polyisoprenoid-binding protein [Anaerolineaceae bacterium]